MAKESFLAYYNSINDRNRISVPDKPKEVVINNTPVEVEVTNPQTEMSKFFKYGTYISATIGTATMAVALGGMIVNILEYTVSKHQHEGG